MAIGRTNAGGGTSLNFKVVGGTTQPTSPKENTIWVKTDVAIPSWAFSATEPGSPVAGMVWFATGRSSTVAFNALRKNDVHVYPTGAKQYIGGEWVSKEAEAYQGSKWTSFAIYLYDYGDECEELTGGWKAYAYKTSTSGSTATAPTVTRNKNSITLSLSSSGSTYRAGAFFAENKIDLTDVNTIKINVVEINAVDNSTRLTVANNKANNYTSEAAVSLGTTTPGVFSMDVSQLSGEHYVNVRIQGGTAKITFDAIWLEG